MIVCIEGLDGSGKSTQVALLAERLKARVFKFPDKRTPTGKLIYEHLEGGWCTTSSKATDALVFQALQLANRMEVAGDIMEAASRGNVVFDRYWPSGYAYGKADGLDGEYLIKLHQWLPQPDLFILLDSTPEVLRERRPEARDRYERNAHHLEEVAENYRGLWRRMVQDPHDFPTQRRRWVLVPQHTRGGVQDVAARINEAVAAYREGA